MSDPVARLYQEWPYPAPCGDLGMLRLDAPDSRYNYLRTLYPLYWPSAPLREDLDILVVGCGTMAAACYAFLFPRARVLGIDISSTSLAHEAFLKEKHGLANLELREQPVEDAVALGESFDFIACCGVLHHLADPVAGLRALGRVLRTDGVIDLMVYAQYGREGIYMLQRLLRLVGAEADAAGVLAVKELLAVLPPTHPAQRYIQLAGDLNNDAGLVDTFLHCRDRAFTCSDCLKLVAEAGLVFQGWEENALYYPDAHVRADAPFRARLDRLPDCDLWQAIELFYGHCPGHYFHVCRPERDPASYVIQFDDLAFLDYIPVLRVSQVTPVIVRPPFPPISLDAVQAAVFFQINGRRTVRECMEAAGVGGTRERKTEYARQFFRSLWRWGYAMFRLGG